MQPVIHIGFAKSASTLLQQRIFPDVPGYRYLSASDYTPLGTTYLPDIPEGSPVHALSGMEDVILSNHAFLHYHLPLPWREYPRRQRIDIAVANLSTLCRERGKIAVVLRRQDSAIESRLKYAGDQYARADCFFLDFPMRGKSWNVRKQVGENPIYKAQCLKNVYGGTFTSSYDYFDILQRLATAVDKKRIHVLLFEDLIHNPKTFLAGLESLFETDLSDLTPRLGEKVNKSPEQPKAPHPFFTRGLAYGRSPANFIRQRLGRLLARPLRLTDSEKKRFLDIYRDGNERLAKAFDLPLEHYGYF